MNKLVRFIQNYLIAAFPLVIACAIWSMLSNGEAEILRDASLFTKAAWEILSWNLIFWFAVIGVFLVLLVVSPKAREKTLKRLANLKERDEREHYITGKAARAAYISSLSVLILFLFISTFTLKVSQLPASEAIEGKTKNISVGFTFSPTDDVPIQANDSGQMLFETKGIPLSKSAIILVLLVWQLAVFNLAARKEQMRNT